MSSLLKNKYVMVTADQVSVLMSGKPGDAAFVDVRSIGSLGGDVNGQLSQKKLRADRQVLSLATGDGVEAENGL